MNVMQYTIRLPASYDMRIIRERVATRGHLLDELPGLTLKAYCMQERGVAGATENQYAPFYLWNDVDAMAAFLRGSAFDGVRTSFGRPRVRHWIGIAAASRGAVSGTPHWATRSLERLREHHVPRERIDQAEREHRAVADREGMRTAVLALDSTRWELVHFTLWTTRPHGAIGTLYQVLHVSEPGTARVQADATTARRT